MKKVVLKKGRQASLLRRHPWIFSGAIHSAPSQIKSGETVLITDDLQTPIAIGAFSPKSQIRVRVWSFNPQEKIDLSFFRNRLNAAIEKRKTLKLPEQTNAYRLVNAEADGLPGLIVDYYAQYLVIQILSAGAEYWKDGIVQRLRETINPKGIYERSDAEARKKEGLPLQKGLIWGEEPPDRLRIEENGLHFWVDIKNGHKTGFYLDQRENRKLVSEFAENKDVLNCFAFTGGFGLSAAKGRAKSVVNVEAVAGLLTEIEQNIKLNRLNPNLFENIKGDAFRILRKFVEDERKFDLIILDPPKFAERQSHLPKASRGYKDINLQAFKLLKTGGYLFTFSCSGLMKPDLFRKIVSDAALDAGREAQILKFLSQDKDHPIVLNIPESEYLKGLLLKVW